MCLRAVRLPSSMGDVEVMHMDWENGIVRPVGLEALGLKYRRYRLVDPPAEEAMGSAPSLS